MSSTSSGEFSALTHKGEGQVSAGLRRLWGRICFKTHSGCWQNPVLCGCRPEVPISLLAVGQGPLSSLRGHLLSSLYGPSSFKPAMACQVLLMLPLLLPARENSSHILRSSTLGLILRLQNPFTAVSRVCLTKRP